MENLIRAAFPMGRWVAADTLENLMELRVADSKSNSYYLIINLSAA
jgi:hypothetical protein